MNKKKVMTLTMLMLFIVSAINAMAAVPSELDCSSFENESTQICTDLDQVGTGVALMSYKLNLGLPTFLMGLAFVTVVIAIVYAIVFIIKSALTRVGSGAKFK